MSSPRGGAHERHLKRRQDNPLFPPPIRKVDGTAVKEARRRDVDERTAFDKQFLRLLEESLRLKPNETSEKLLDLKGRLDQAYTLLASLGGEHEPYRQGLRRLTDTLVAAIRRAAGGDPTAVAELAQEQLAREQHYRLLEFPLVADLMRPDSPVASDELVATLLSVQADELEAALWLFDAEQLAAIYREASVLVEAVGTVQAQTNLAVLRVHLQDAG